MRQYVANLTKFLKYDNSVWLLSVLFCDNILHYYILEFSKPRGFSNVISRMYIHALAQASMTLDRKVTY